MDNQPTLEAIQKAFDGEGNQCDIYLFHTQEPDWQLFIDDLRESSVYETIFLLDNEPQPLPLDVKSIFQLNTEHAVRLKIDEDQLDIDCHFFIMEAIELTFDPRIITNEHLLTRFLDFFHHLANLLHRKIVLTPENLEDVHYISFDPVTQSDAWSLPGWRRDSNSLILLAP